MISLISSIFEKADKTKLTGLSTSKSFLPVFHDVFIDRESLPTGIVIFSSLHNSDKRLTPKNSLLISSLLEEDAIQFAESFMFSSFFILQQEILVIISPKLKSIDELTFDILGIGLSPIVITSPDFEFISVNVAAILETGT